MVGDWPADSQADRNFTNSENSPRDFPKAKECSEKSLYIVRELGDLRNTNKYSFESTILHNALRRFCIDVCGYVVYVNPKRCRSQISSSSSFFIVVDRPIQRSTSGILSLYLFDSK